VLTFASAEYVNGVINNAVSFLPPVLVTHALGAALSAYFYIPWIIGVAVTTLLWNIVLSFVVEATTDGARAREHVNRAAGLVAAVVGGGALVLVLAATPLLRLLGADYAAEGATSLRLIGLSLPFTGIFVLYGAFSVMEKRMWRMVLIQSVGAVVFLGGSLLGLHTGFSLFGLHTGVGLEAPAWALLVSQGGIGLVLLPGLIKKYRATGARHVDRPTWAGR
jgi:O-antigen/teichoic acid export membrane protein